MLAVPPEPAGEPVAAPSALTLKHVSYSVGGLEVLRDVSARFAAGGKYLITGESGSGKSTLLRLLAQIGDTDYSGGIFCNQTEIRRASRNTYYERICPVFQEPYLFCATLEENICLGRQISRKDYDSVLEKLKLTYLAERCRNQALTPELMETLSGGERQRVALARAMVGHPAVYLLDEVTSALDPENAENVEQLLLQEPAMVLHVCHKPNPNLIARYDGMFTLTRGTLTKENP